jgi:hypothetical protein
MGEEEKAPTILVGTLQGKTYMCSEILAKCCASVREI